jgi:sec-independent protein translocase protein TatB
VSFSETLFLFFLALVVFGPKKLPEIARQVGKILNEFRRASNEFKSQIEQEIAHLEVENKKQAVLKASPTPEGTMSRTLSPTPSEPVPATLATAPEAGNEASASVIATEAVASAVTSASSESASPSSSSTSQDIPQATAQHALQSHVEATQAESAQKSQESHA